MKTIGLCMIVRNEAHVIARCLNSVRPLVDYVLVEDTGSTDGTQEVIWNWTLRNKIGGLVIEEPWQDFAYNRSHVIAALREVESVDYALIIDADDELVLEPDFDPIQFKEGMRLDLYDVQIRHGDCRFLRPQLCNNRMPFCFKGVLHEYLEAPTIDLNRTRAEGFYIQTGRGGVRNRNPQKYQNDAATLERALRTETDPFLISRYAFYLAQSYRDCGKREKALTYYLKRAELGYWREEIFYSLYQAGKLQESLSFPPEEVIATYLRASEASPSRAEALHSAARYCRSLGRNEEGYQYAKRGAEKPMPDAGLFVESWIYDYGLLDELGVNGYWSGRYRESLDSCLRLLGSFALPADQRERIMRNAQFGFGKLPGDANSSVPPS